MLKLNKKLQKYWFVTKLFTIFLAEKWWSCINRVITIRHLYIFSVEKFLENPDVEQYRTIDTVNLKSKDIDVKVENFSNYKTLIYY